MEGDQAADQGGCCRQSSLPRSRLKVQECDASCDYWSTSESISAQNYHGTSGACTTTAFPDAFCQAALRRPCFKCIVLLIDAKVEIPWPSPLPPYREIPRPRIKQNWWWVCVREKVLSTHHVTLELTSYIKQCRCNYGYMKVAIEDCVQCGIRRCGACPLKATRQR